MSCCNALKCVLLLCFLHRTNHNHVLLRCYAFSAAMLKNQPYRSILSESIKNQSRVKRYPYRSIQNHTGALCCYAGKCVLLLCFTMSCRYALLLSAYLQKRSIAREGRTNREKTEPFSVVYRRFGGWLCYWDYWRAPQMAFDRVIESSGTWPLAWSPNPFALDRWWFALVSVVGP